LGVKLLVLTVGVTVSSWLIGRVYQQVEKQKAFNEAYAYAEQVKKPVLNAGCGSLPPYGDVNLDVVPKSVPNFVLGDIEDMPFEDKEFASCVASHVLEHTNDPEKALRECERVADRVWIIEPPLWDSGTWLTPTHKWLVIKGRSTKFVRYNPAGGWALALLKLITAGGL